MRGVGKNYNQNQELIKALFFDLDGTLLTSSRKLSDKTKTVLKKCREVGIKVFTATARPPLLSKMLNLTTEEEEIIQDGGIFYNGGCICYNNKKLYTFLFASIKKLERDGIVLNSKGREITSLTNCVNYSGCCICFHTAGTKGG